jgi:hypothetical protein
VVLVGEKKSKAGGLGAVRVIPESIVNPEFTGINDYGVALQRANNARAVAVNAARESGLSSEAVSQAGFDAYQESWNSIPVSVLDRISASVKSTESDVRAAADLLGIRLDLYTPEGLLKSIIGSPATRLVKKSVLSTPESVTSYVLGEKL